MYCGLKITVKIGYWHKYMGLVNVNILGNIFHEKLKKL